MRKIDIKKLETSEKIELVRELLDNVPEQARKDEIERLKRIESNIPVLLLTAPDGTLRKASTVKGAMAEIENLTGKKPDISNVYKVLRGELKTIFGIKIQRYLERENNNGITDKSRETKS